MVYYCMNSELPLIQSTENDIINIMGSSKKTQKVGGTFKKKRPREWAEHCIKRPVTGQK